MQIKEVKIFGFQSKEVKITLTYQASLSFQRYILRINRKIIRTWKKNDINAEFKAQLAFANEVSNTVKQLKIDM